MKDFLVLGMVPGTTIQITFVEWLEVATALIGGLCLLIAHARHTHPKHLIVWPVAVSTTMTISNLFLKSAYRRFEVNILSLYARLLAPMALLLPENRAADDTLETLNEQQIA